MTYYDLQILPRPNIPKQRDWRLLLDTLNLDRVAGIVMNAQLLLEQAGLPIGFIVVPFWGYLLGF